MKRMFDENEIRQIASEAGGGKLYLHNLNIDVRESSYTQLKIINTDPSKITSVTNELLKKRISGQGSSSFPPAYSNLYNIAVLDGSRLSVTTYATYPFASANTSTYEVNLSQAKIVDSVTEL